MTDLKHARMMIELAEKDLQALRNMTDAGHFDEPVFGFVERQVRDAEVGVGLAGEGRNAQA